MLFLQEFILKKNFIFFDDFKRFNKLIVLIISMISLKNDVLKLYYDLDLNQIEKV